MHSFSTEKTTIFLALWENHICFLNISIAEAACLYLVKSTHKKSWNNYCTCIIQGQPKDNSTLCPQSIHCEVSRYPHVQLLSSCRNSQFSCLLTLKPEAKIRDTVGQTKSERERALWFKHGKPAHLTLESSLHSPEPQRWFSASHLNTTEGRYSLSSSLPLSCSLSLASLSHFISFSLTHFLSVSFS